jgi:hypothetical protein
MSASFDLVWQYLQSHLRPGMVIKNWTVFSGYLGKDLTIVHLSLSEISVDTPNAKTTQHIPRDDFEAVWEVWADYKNGIVLRKDIREFTRFSKYIISTLHWYEQEVLHA